MKKENIKYILNLIIKTTLVLLIALIVNLKFTITKVEGRSMYPTLKDGDLILLDKTKELEDSDIISLNMKNFDKFKDYGCEKKDDYLIIKRYIEDKSTDGLYILGDNQEVSFDSSYYGEVEKDRVVGVAVLNITQEIEKLKDKIFK